MKRLLWKQILLAFAITNKNVHILSSVHANAFRSEHMSINLNTALTSLNISFDRYYSKNNNIN